MSRLITPNEFFGFRMGSDRKIARWDKIVEYWYLLQEQSNRIQVNDMGPSTEGEPFLEVIISSPENLMNLESLREINLKISDPRGLTEGEVKDLIAKGKAVVCQSMSLHASEIGGTQMAPELAYDLLSRDDEETARILENVIFVMVPCFNPDGQIMVTDWYNQMLGTEYEGVMMPWLYHKYAGHDNNRDAFQTNLQESKYVAEILFRKWMPQAYVDHHHMGSYGARFYIPPYCEPFRPYADPLVYREHAWYGAHQAYMLEEAGKKGVIGGAMPFPAWGHFGWHRITNHHNISGMLTESASAKLATPLYIHPDQLVGGHYSFPEYAAQVNFPHPWEGGWWTLREIVEQQKICSWATLDIAAQYKDMVLRNAYLKAKRQIERGVASKTKAYVVPRAQHDPITMGRLIEKLLIQGIEIHVANEAFNANAVTYPSGSYIIRLDQPKYGLIRSLLGRTYYPDNAWTRDQDGTPRKPKDKGADTMHEFMGVKVDPVECTFEANMTRINEPVWPSGGLEGESTIGYALDPRLNDTFAAVNKLLVKGAQVRRSTESLDCGDMCLPPGAFIINGVEKEELEQVAAEKHITLYPLSDELGSTTQVNPPRVALFQRYYGGNTDEGWTRLVLEQFGFPYTSIMDQDIREGGLHEKYDIIIIPNDSEAMITGEGLEEYARDRGRPLPNFPPEYRSGLGDDGVEALREFVRAGGRLVCLNASSEFAGKAFNLNVRNALRDLATKEFFCPGSTIHAEIDPSHPMGYGMPSEGLVFFWDSLAFEILPSGENDRYEVVVSYGERDLLESGWLIGEEKLRKKPAMVVASVGEGEVVLFGFRPQHRAQTHSTYKLLFNTLL
ncbi:MAG: M14 family metallopeptidase [Candidatus Bathyarchaeota archaeon]|jgi:hypothetical protein